MYIAILKIESLYNNINIKCYDAVILDILRVVKLL